MKDKVNQLFKEKIILVTLVLCLVTVVAAAGVITIRKGSGSPEEGPYPELQKQEHLLAEETEIPPIAGNSNALAEAAEKPMKESAENPAETQVPIFAEAAAETEEQVLEAGAAADGAAVLNFTGDGSLIWPVTGHVLLGYSMDTTTWFPTLEQYKCNPANVIQSETGVPVLAPANARVMEIGQNEEIGQYVLLDLGNRYTAVCGQLKEIPVTENEYLEKGAVIGSVAEPTRYYSVEGSNLYFQLLHDGKPVDALDYLE